MTGNSRLFLMFDPGRRPGHDRALGLCLLALALAMGCWHGDARPLQMTLPSRPSAPNLLVIVADDQSGFCLGAAGDRRGATPNLDALARQGVLFERAFCNSPLCTPSRQSFITGLLPHAVGVTRLATPLPEKALTLGGWLSVLGYRRRRSARCISMAPPITGSMRESTSPDWIDYLKQHPPPAAIPLALETLHRPAVRLAERPVSRRGASEPPWSRPTSWIAPSTT